jgi:hypothetical protein
MKFAKPHRYQRTTNVLAVAVVLVIRIEDFGTQTARERAASKKVVDTVTNVVKERRDDKVRNDGDDDSNAALRQRRVQKTASWQMQEKIIASRGVAPPLPRGR